MLRSASVRALFRIAKRGGDVVDDTATLSQRRVAEDDGHPSILDVLGPDWAKQDAAVYIDDTVLDGERIEERAEIQRETEQSRNVDAV